jgi:hypothetical protein
VASLSRGRERRFPGSRAEKDADMPETTPNTSVRVVYHGITYSICRRCNEVIGSGKNEGILLATERSHCCEAVSGEMDYERDRRLYEERSKR